MFTSPGRNIVLPIGCAIIFALFVIWSSMVRSGRIDGRRILLTGVMLSILMMAVSAAMWWPDYAAHRIPLGIVAINTSMLLPVTAWAVFHSYQSQRVTDTATRILGDVKIIVRIAPVSRLPDAHALLLPTVTSLKMTDGIGWLINPATGPAVQRELNALGPVGMGKVVTTGGGNTRVGRIYHVAVADPGKSVDPERLRKGIESAAQQARKSHAESLVVPIAALRGLALPGAAEAMIGGVLRQRKAFAEIVLLTTNARDAPAIEAAADKTIADLSPAEQAGRLPS